jgi:hypothetical protein
MSWYHELGPRTCGSRRCLATGQAVELAAVDQGYAGAQPAAKAAIQCIRLEVVRHPEATQGFVLLPRLFFVNALAAYLLGRALRRPARMGLTVAAGLAQVSAVPPDGPAGGVR